MKGTAARLEDTLTVDEEIKDPLVLEFLGLKDEYSESELENALVHHLEHFMLELGNDFAFIARQRAAPHRRRMVSRRSSPFSPEIALPRCDPTSNSVGSPMPTPGKCTFT